MTDRPIIFSAPMVRALLDGRKSMTRRVLKPQPQLVTGRGKRVYADSDWRHSWREYGNDDMRFAVGDRLWVRESWNVFSFSRDGDTNRPCVPIPETDPRDDVYVHFEVHYAATTPDGPWRPSIHMPRWASRLTLVVTAVKVERLQEISEADAFAEGRRPHFDYDNPEVVCGIPLAPLLSSREDFAQLWDSLHGPDAWAANPWVVALTFTTHKANIDQLAKAA